MANSRRVAVLELVGDESQVLRICKDRTDATTFLKDFFENDQNHRPVNETELREDINICYKRGGTLRESSSYSVAKVLCENGAGGTIVRIILDTKGLGLTVPVRFLDENFDNVTKEQLSASFKTGLQEVAKTQVVSLVPRNSTAYQVGFLAGDILLQRPERPSSAKTELQLCNTDRPSSTISLGHVGRCLFWKRSNTMSVAAASPAVSVASDNLSSFGSPWTPATSKSAGTARSQRLPFSASKKANAAKPIALFGSPKPLPSGPGSFSFAIGGAPKTAAPTSGFGQFSFGAPVPAPAPTTVGGLFGAPAPAAASAFGSGATFGSLATGIRFGTSPAPAATSAFGSGATFGSPATGSPFGTSPEPAAASAFGINGASFGSPATGIRFGTSLGSVGSTPLFGDATTARSSQKIPGASSLSKASSSSRKKLLRSASFAPQSNNRGDTPKPNPKLLGKANATGSANSDLLGSLRLNSKKPSPFSFGTGRQAGTSSSFGTVDPPGASFVGRDRACNAAFDRRGDDEELDDEEKEEERVKAAKAFLSLATHEDGHDVVAFSQLEDLFIALGSTYCDDDYGEELQALEKEEPGKIRLGDFLTWYMDWLFGTSDESSDDEEEKPGAASAGPVQNSWGDIFKKPNGSWRCDNCMSQGNPGDTKCLACEEPRPGWNSSFPPMSAKAPTPFGFSA